MRLLSWLAPVALVASGCAAPAYVGQTGRVTPKEDFRVGLGLGYQVNTSGLAVVREGRALAEQLRANQVACPDPADGDCWRAEDLAPVVRSGMRFALVAPASVNTSVSGRYGFADGLDLGLRWGPDNYGADLGWQLFGPRDPGVEGWSASVFGGWGRRDMGTLGAVIEDVLQGSASLDDYSLTLVAGRQFGRFGHLYLGGRYIYTTWELLVLPDLPVVYDAATTQRALLGTDASGHLSHFGGVLGGAIGYEKVFLGLELNLVQTSGRADVLFEDVSFSGFGVMPTIYLYGQF